MDKYIDIGTKINLTDLVQTRLLIQANSGGGKSALARTIMEQSVGKIPFVVMDLDGEYYTLKEFEGDIVVIGGQHGDVAISLDIAGALPRFIIENGLSVVLDLSDLKMGERIRFARLFLEALMELPQKFWVPYLVFLEEAHKLCGEQDKQESAGAVKDLMSRGRKKGYAGVLITQRISKLHKDVSAECNNKFIGRTFQDIDMDRSAKELGFSNSRERLKLRDLKPGCFYAFGTSIEPHHVHEVQVKLPASQMPKAGSIAEMTAKRPTAALLATISKLQELPAKEKPGKAVASKAAAQILPQEKEAYEKEIAVLVSQSRKDMETIALQALDIEKLTQANVHLEKVIDLAVTSLKTGFINKTLNGWTEPKERPAPALVERMITNVRNPADMPETVAVNIPFSYNKLPKGEDAVLRCVASYPNGLSRTSISVITGYSRRTRDAYLQKLKEKALIDQVSGGRIVASAAGMKELGKNFKRLPKGHELYEHWMKQLPTGERAVLEAAARSYPGSITREKISEVTGYTRRTRDAYIQKMIHKEIVTAPRSGVILVSELLFD